MSDKKGKDKAEYDANPGMGRGGLKRRRAIDDYVDSATSGAKPAPARSGGTRRDRTINEAADGKRHPATRHYPERT